MFKRGCCARTSAYPRLAGPLREHPIPFRLPGEPAVARGLCVYGLKVPFVMFVSGSNGIYISAVDIR